MDLTKRNKSKIHAMDTKFLGSIEERTSMDRIKNETLSRETRLQIRVKRGITIMVWTLK